MDEAWTQIAPAIILQDDFFQSDYSVLNEGADTYL